MNPTTEVPNRLHADYSKEYAMLLNMEYLGKLEHFFNSGDLAFEFEHGTEEKRGEILEFLEKLMDVAEVADELATRLIFKDNYMEAMEEAKKSRQ